MQTGRGLRHLSAENLRASLPVCKLHPVVLHCFFAYYERLSSGIDANSIGVNMYRFAFLDCEDAAKWHGHAEVRNHTPEMCV